MSFRKWIALMIAAVLALSSGCFAFGEAAPESPAQEECIGIISAMQNEVDLLIKEEGEITALEVKSSQTYSPSFEATLRKLSGWIKTPLRKKGVVYAGEFENTAGDIGVINYKHLEL